jgi:hypothetical protein
VRIEWIACAVGLVMLGCSGGDDSGDNVAIVDGPLSGTVGGESWTVVRAETNPFLSEGEPDYWTDLYATGGTACETGSLGGGHHLILQAPREPGEYRLSFRYTATFVIEGEIFENLIATTGRVVIEEVTTSTIRGGAFIRFDADNSVNGRFQITICP